MLKSLKVFTLVLAAGTFTACGDDDPLSSVTVPPHAGANTPITEANVNAVVGEYLGAIDGALLRVVQGAAGGSSANISGLSSGSINPGTGDYTLQSEESKAEFTGTVTFTNFSDFGSFFSGAEFSVSLEHSLTNNPTADNRRTYELEGPVVISGSYAGGFVLDVQIDYTQPSPVVTGTVEIDGNTRTVSVALAEDPGSDE